MPASAIVVVNPSAAGGRAGRLRDRVAACLARHSAETPMLVAGLAEARARAAALPAGSRVVLAGGDGTVHRMLPVLVERGLELGLVPTGSGNDFARAIGVSGQGLEKALEHALGAPATACDLGEVRTPFGTAHFASSLSVGFDAAVASRAAGSPAWLGGMPRYLAATLAELAALRPHRMRLTVDGRRFHDGEALFAACLNTPTYGAGMPIAPHADVRDGALDLVLAGRFGRLGALAMLPRLLLGRHLGHPEVRALRFAELAIEADSPIPVAADGEPLGEFSSLAARVLPGALRVAAGAPYV
ncbi:hypothetical protein M6I34_08440 [Burkholderiaceae bacterium FT117]|uniref:diacylglycerol/lipid kinase family protein n=1 Tax=Zeimonas sediminis TaxID=2944268 RepID=UPI002343011D|nr:diacylglycerol kinase family protein [Zeimonas sediminis]MCM5570534.1 hypothetical protein [Zeimonas sediminis]